MDVIGFSYRITQRSPKKETTINYLLRLTCDRFIVLPYRVVAQMTEIVTKIRRGRKKYGRATDVVSLNYCYSIQNKMKHNNIRPFSKAYLRQGHSAAVCATAAEQEVTSQIDLSLLLPHPAQSKRKSLVL